MSVDLIKKRLESYVFKNKQEEFNALKEIAQEIVLLALFRANFFKIGAFQGGTCLRIIHSLPRFSEDLDFVLQVSDKKFSWDIYLKEIQLEFQGFGLHLEVQDRSETSGIVKKAFIKEDSFGKVLTLQHFRNKSDSQKIKIKLEIDTNPPQGSNFESNFVDFPYPFSIVTQDLESLFAGKCHALLCREYIKGRDWYDFLWYIRNKVKVNVNLLTSALIQKGPWINQKVEINRDWLISKFEKKIEEINWNVASQDVRPFLKIREIESLSQWDNHLFKHYLKSILVTS
jgi:predicted nucleotidyltransferase component of viral defense system